MVKFLKAGFSPHLSERNGEKMDRKWTNKWFINGWKMAA